MIVSLWLAVRMDASEKRLTEEELYSTYELLRKLTPEHELLQLAPLGPTAVYTTLVTLWMLTMQRLNGGSSLASVVKVVQTYCKNLLPNNKRVRDGTLSKSSAAYSEARKRLPIEAAEFFANSVCDSLVARSPSWFRDQRAYILDGTTITLSPTSSLAEAFPPATNQHGITVWPILMLLVAHELQSGCALIPEIGAMYGEKNTSEAKLAAAIAKRLPPRSIVIADSGFGIFRVCHAMIRGGHDILIRLTKSRYKAMRRQAELTEETETSTKHLLRWMISTDDRKANPDLPADAVLHVILHEITLESGDVLMLVTTLPYSSEEAAEAYSYRYDVEHDIRDLKVTMQLEKIRARTEEMVRKEILCSVVAYNLVLEFRREAGKIAKLPPRRLSFTGVWNTFEIFLLHQPPCNASKWIERYEQALLIASKDKLPNRPGRNYPRKAHYRRPKWAKSAKDFTPKETIKRDVSDKPPPK
jgi:Transposase DDE domain